MSSGRGPSPCDTGPRELRLDLICPGSVPLPRDGTIPVGDRANGAEVSTYTWRVDTREAAQRWADVWERGWREHDVEAIVALYADDAFWQQNPFRDPEPGYLARVFEEEESAECEFGSPIVDGERAAVPWSAQTKLVSGGREELAGVSLLRFDVNGLVVEHRDFGVEIVHPATPREPPKDHAP